MVVNNVNNILNSVFEEWQKQALEFTVQGAPVTLEKQFLYYYRDSDFRGTEEDLKTALQIKIQDNLHILYQLTDLIKNITNITTLDQYNSVKLEFAGTLNTEASVSASANINTSNSTSKDKYKGTDITGNTSNNTTESGSSETNKTVPIESVLKPLEPKSHNLTEDVSIGYQERDITNRDLKYQNFGIESNYNNSLNKTATDSTQDNTSTSNNQGQSTTHSTKGSKSDQSKQTVEFITIDERVKMWNLEIPKLRRKFWQSLSNLFTYEYR